MANILHTIHTIERRLESSLGRFLTAYPRLSYLFLFIGVPAFLIAALFVCTAAIMLPIAAVLGWL